MEDHDGEVDRTPLVKRSVHVPPSKDAWSENVLMLADFQDQKSNERTEDEDRVNAPSQTNCCSSTVLPSNPRTGVAFPVAEAVPIVAGPESVPLRVEKSSVKSEEPDPAMLAVILKPVVALRQWSGACQLSVTEEPEYAGSGSTWTEL